MKKEMEMEQEVVQLCLQIWVGLRSLITDVEPEKEALEASQLPQRPCLCAHQVSLSALRTAPFSTVQDTSLESPPILRQGLLSNLMHTANLFSHIQTQVQWAEDPRAHWGMSPRPLCTYLMPCHAPGPISLSAQLLCCI